VRSALAVAGQLTVSASNYVVFLVLARLLEREAFVGFSTAVGLSMLAWAVAEGGLSYVAPRELADETKRRDGSLAGAYLALMAGLYVAVAVGGFTGWNLFAREGLDPRWVLGYGAFVLPSLLVPSWLTCWTLDGIGLSGIVLARLLMVGAIIAVPGPLALGASGLGFLLFIVWLYARLNRTEVVVARPDVPGLRKALRSLGDVFLARTVSFGVYGLVPLMVGVSRGSLPASEYVTGERLKSLYTALFQPAVQTTYLLQFRKTVTASAKRLAQVGVHAGNAVLCAGILFGVGAGLLGLLGERFVEVADVWIYLLAGGLSVASAGILHFRVFPAGAFGTFRRATLAQMLAFSTMFVLLWTGADIRVAWVLGAAEAALFLTLIATTRISGDPTDAPEAPEWPTTTPPPHESTSS
jgi:hypothetical protein